MAAVELVDEVELGGLAGGGNLFWGESQGMIDKEVLSSLGNEDFQVAEALELLSMHDEVEHDRDFITGTSAEAQEILMALGEQKTAIYAERLRAEGITDFEISVEGSFRSVPDPWPG